MKIARLLIPFFVITLPVFTIFIMLMGTDSPVGVVAVSVTLVVALYAIRNRTVSSALDFLVARLTPQIEPAEFNELIDDFCRQVSAEIGSGQTDYRRRFRLRIRLSDRYVPYGGPIDAKVYLTEGARDRFAVTDATLAMQAKLQVRLSDFLKKSGTQAIGLSYLSDEDGDMVSRYFRPNEFLTLTPTDKIAGDEDEAGVQEDEQEVLGVVDQNLDDRSPDEPKKS